jgi:hypothetical protein
MALDNFLADRQPNAGTRKFSVRVKTPKITKIISAYWASMPIPLSVTENRHISPSLVQPTCTRGGLLSRYLMPLPMRFCSNCLSWVSSPGTVASASHVTVAPASSMAGFRLLSTTASVTLQSTAANGLPVVATRE